MAVRPPSRYAQGSWGSGTPEAGLNLLDHEIMAEKAAALGRAGARVESCVARLRAHDRVRASHAESAGDRETRRKLLLKEAAEAVYAFFIQRELCGLRRHDAVVRELGIPREVLVRLGAK